MTAEATHSTHTPTPNASTARTRKRIHDAFLKLAETTDFAAINVNLLTKQAGLNRTTFYLHYPTMQDLIDEIVENLLANIGEAGRRMGEGVGIDHPSWRETYFRIIGSNPVLYRRLMGTPGSSPLSRRLIDMLQQHTLMIWRTNGFAIDENPDDWAMRSRFCASGAYGATLQWLETDMRQSTDHMCERMLQLMLAVASEGASENGGS